MKKNNLKANAAVAFLLSAGILSAPTAMAASASSSLGSIEIIAIPLSPGASLTWTGDYDWSSSVAYTTNPYQYDNHWDNNSDWNSFLGTLASTSGANASSSSTPSANGPTLLNIANASIESAPSWDYWEYSYAQAYSGDQRSFSTTGNMAIYISADYSLSADPGNGLTSGYAYADASLNAYFSGTVGHHTSYSYYNASDYVYASAYPWWNDGVQSSADTFSIGILTTGTGYGSITGNSDAYAYQYAMPVPEPETYAMLLVGLGLISFTLRKKEA